MAAFTDNEIILGVLLENCNRDYIDPTIQIRLINSIILLQPPAPAPANPQPPALANQQFVLNTFIQSILDIRSVYYRILQRELNLSFIVSALYMSINNNRNYIAPPNLVMPFNTIILEMDILTIFNSIIFDGIFIRN